MLFSSIWNGAVEHPGILLIRGFIIALLVEKCNAFCRIWRKKAAGSAYIRYGNIACQVVAGFGVPVAADDGFGGQGGVIVQDAHW